MITVLKYGRTVSRGKGTFEFERVDAESTPDTGQTPEDAFGVLRAFVDATVVELLGVPTEKETKKEAAKPAEKPVAKSTAPPLAAKKKDPSPNQSSVVTGTTSDPPFEPGKKAVAEPAPKKPKGRPKKSTAEVPGVAEILATIPSTTRVADVLDKLNEMRSVADRTKGEAVDDWEKCLKLVAAHLRSIPGHTEDASYEDICAAFDAETEAIATARG